MENTVIITGGAGFIGSALIRHLIRATDLTVVNVDCLTYAGNLSSVTSVQDSSRYHLEREDIRDLAALRRLFDRYRPRAVSHLAAESHVDRSIDGPADFVQTNVVGTVRLLEAARDYFEQLSSGDRRRFRFHHVSTDEVYGSLGDKGVFHEASSYSPNSPYAASKAASDHFARAWGVTYGLPVLVSNSSNNYGPYQFPEKLIPHMIFSALEGQELPVYGDGENVRDWLYVEDHARALRRVLQAGEPGETYLVGGRNELRNIEVVQAICDILDEKKPREEGGSYRKQIRFVEDRPGHDYRYAVDPSKIETELAWSPAETFETGLEKTVDWYLESETWWREIRSGRYRGERLGLLE